MKIKKKKLLSTIFITFIFVCFSFVDKDLFENLKDTVIKEFKNATTSVPGASEIVLNDELVVSYLDVGQADSILIKSQNEYMLIDAGNNADGDKLVKYFVSLGIKEFKYVFGTHAHEDHVGGMDNIIKNFKVNNFYMPDATTTTQTFAEILDALDNKNLAFKTPEIDSKLKLGNSTVEVIYVGSNKDDLNDTSIVLKVTYNDISFLFTGDATSNVERGILDKNIESTVLKVGHHGSKYSSSAVFLNKINPKYAIISCGLNNDYGHPHDVVVNKLEKIGAKIYRTDKQGTIVAITDGESITFKTIKTDTNGE